MENKKQPNYDKIEILDEGTSLERTEYTLKGKLHRLDGPAREYADGQKEWFQNGEWHRTDGPDFSENEKQLAKDVKVSEITKDYIIFENGFKLESYHETQCCEAHYLDFSTNEIEDFEGLKFDLSNDDFFERVKNYGIRLKPKNNFPVSIPGYGINNGCYSCDMDLILYHDKKPVKFYNIKECQEFLEDEEGF